MSRIKTCYIPESIVMRVGGIPDVVDSGRTGLLFAPKSKSALHSTFVYVYGHRLEVETMRCEALEIAREYAFENQIEILRKQLNK